MKRESSSPSTRRACSFCADENSRVWKIWLINHRKRPLMTRDTLVSVSRLSAGSALQLLAPPVLFAVDFGPFGRRAVCRPGVIVQLISQTSAHITRIALCARATWSVLLCRPSSGTPLSQSSNPSTCDTSFISRKDLPCHSGPHFPKFVP